MPQLISLHKSISLMTNEEAINLIINSRQRRRENKKPVVIKTASAKRQNQKLMSSPKTAMMALTKEQKAELLKFLLEK